MEEECGWGEVPIKKKVCGVVQRQIKKWRECGAPYITGNAWFKVMMVLGQGNPDLAEVVEIADAYEDTDQDSHKYNLKNLRIRQQMRVAQGWKSKVKEDIANG